MSFDSKNRLPRHAAVDDNEAMLTDPPKAEPPQRKRRWFQFSLRSLLVIVAVVAVQCGICLPMLREWQRQSDQTERDQKMRAVIAAWEARQVGIVEGRWGEAENSSLRP